MTWSHRELVVPSEEVFDASKSPKSKQPQEITSEIQLGCASN